MLTQTNPHPQGPEGFPGRAADKPRFDDSRMDYESLYLDLRKPGFIPGYEILQKLGGGVFGEVFKVRKESIGRIYCIKFLKIDGEAQRQVIEKELASLHNFAQIDHPNLVGIEDQGVVSGIPYIIMTFAGDDTLQDKLAEGVMPEAARNSVFHQIVSGVEGLHQRNIVHFDLKPANIFIRDDTVRVGDYGLSKLLSESRQSLSFGRGTPYYMAPEVMRRKGDLRSDVYSLGALLFELVTGCVPFDGDSDWEVLKQHEVDPVPFPATFPRDLRAVVATAMAKDPERRYASAAEMRMAFAAAVGGAVSESQVMLPEQVVSPKQVVSPESGAVGVDPAPGVTATHPAAERIGLLASEAASRLREQARAAASHGSEVVPPLSPPPPPRPAPAPPPRPEASAPSAAEPVVAAPPDATAPPTGEASRSVAEAPRRSWGLGIMLAVVTLVGAAMLAAMGALFLLVSGGPEVPIEPSPPPTAEARPPVPTPVPTPVVSVPRNDGIVPAVAEAGPEPKQQPRREELRALLKDVISVVDRLNSYGKTVEDLIELARDPAVIESLERMKSEPKTPAAAPAPSPESP